MPHPENSPAFPADLPEPSVVVYAGFWRRLSAQLIDFFILQFLFFPLDLAEARFYHEWGIIGTPQALYLSLLLNLAVVGLYQVPFESSLWQATPGKRLLGLRVTTRDGKRLLVLRAGLRFLYKQLLSGGITLGVGFLMIAFTRRKQGLHDRIARCLVIQAPRQKKRRLSESEGALNE